MGNSAYLEHNGRMVISSTLIACLLFSIYLGGHLDPCLSIQVSYYPNVSSWNLYSIMLMPVPCGCLASKSGRLTISTVVKVITLLVTYFQLTRLLSSHVLAEPHLVVLKHYGKREVLHLIDQMEDCFNHPFEFDPEAIESTRKVRGASAVEPGQWGYGINVYGKRWRYHAKASEKGTLNTAMYGFGSDEEYSRVQAYLHSHGGYQLEVVSTGHIPLGR